MVDQYNGSRTHRSSATPIIRVIVANDEERLLGMRDLAKSSLEKKQQNHAGSRRGFRAHPCERGCNGFNLSALNLNSLIAALPAHHGRACETKRIGQRGTRQLRALRCCGRKQKNLDKKRSYAEFRFRELFQQFWAC